MTLDTERRSETGRSELSDSHQQQLAATRGPASVLLSNADLPCAKGSCPHGQSCCEYGVELSQAETTQLYLFFGNQCVHYDYDKAVYRTAVVDGWCYFKKGKKCRLHGLKAYPEVCRKFPFDGYEGTGEECPEVEKLKKGKGS